jgi:hypothetical protein
LGGALRPSKPVAGFEHVLLLLVLLLQRLNCGCCACSWRRL